MHHHYIDRFADQDSLVHRLDPRAKTLVVLAYSAVLISLPRAVLPSTWFVVLPFAMLVIGGIPLRFVLRQIVLVSPFIVCLVLFAPLVDRRPIKLADGWWVAEGWLIAASILLRFVLGVSALIALTTTTRFHVLLHGLSKLGMPRLLAVQLQFLYRYLFLLLDQSMHLRQARAARDAGLGPWSGRWRAGASLVGVLFVRTLEQAERTYGAMLNRGYDGTIRLLAPLRWRLADTLFLVVSGIYLVAVRWGA